MPIVILFLTLLFSMQSIAVQNHDLRTITKRKRASAVALAIAAHHTAATRFVIRTRPLDCDLETTSEISVEKFLPPEFSDGRYVSQIHSLCNHQGVLTLMTDDSVSLGQSGVVTGRLLSLTEDVGNVGRIKDASSGIVVSLDGRERTEFQGALSGMDVKAGDPSLLTLW